MSDLVPFWMSDASHCDHLYPGCPIVTRGGATVREGQAGVDPDDPYGLCGWCLRVWKARHP